MAGCRADHLHMHLRRAVEVALAGDMTITVLIEPHYRNGLADFPLIREAYAHLFTGFVPHDGDLLVKLGEPRDGYRTPVRVEEDAVMLERVGRVKARALPEDMDKSAQDLLEVGVRRAGLDLRRTKLAVKAAGVVAALTGSGVIHVEHMAEGVMYQHRATPSGLPLACAMDGAIEFGGGAIRVSPLEIDRTDLLAAIEYLNLRLAQGSI